MDLSKIPDKLKREPYFCLMRLEQKPGKAKKDKVPYRVNGARADPTNEAHFTDLVTVQKVFDQGGYDGIGIGMFGDVIAIDIDGCVEDGKLNAMATEVMEALDTYAEYSISGTGIHLWIKAPGFVYDTKRYYINNQKAHMEVYPAGVTKKFIVTTGNVLNTKDVNQCSESFERIAEKYMVRPNADKVKEPNVRPPGSYLTDESVLKKMFEAKNGEKTKLLWEGNNLDGQSASEGDRSLCNILAFWCGGDTEQMDRLFRQSNRMRDKWDEVHGSDTYGNMTMDRALEFTTEYYKPLGISSALEDFDELVSVLSELKPESNARYKNGDLGKGRLFADVFKNIARYNPDRKSWFIYDGIRWVADVKALKAMELAKDLADAITIYSTTIHVEATREFFTKDFVKKWIQRNSRITYINDAESVYPVPMEKFDSDIYLFNVQNGTIDLRDRSFREHRPEDFITKLAPVEYVPLARSDRFLQFVDEITSRDKGKAKYLQKSLGYSLTGDTRFECMFSTTEKLPEMAKEP